MSSRKPVAGMQANPVITKAIKFLNTGDATSARGILRNYCKKNKNDLQGWYLFSVACGQLGRFEDVVRACNHILKLQPQHPSALTNLANALAAIGQHDDAIQHYEQALKRLPNDPSILGNYGFTLYLAGQHERALPVLQSAAQMLPQHAETHFNLARNCEQLGRSTLAIEHYRKASEIKPDWFDVHLNLADCLRETGQLEDALVSYRKALEINSLSMDAFRGLAITHRYLGDLEGALNVYQQAFDVMPGEPNVVAGMADIQERMGNKEEAYDLIRKIIDGGKICITACDVYLRLCQKYGTCNEAIQLSRDLLDSDRCAENSAIVLNYSAGKLHDKLGNYDQAFGHFKAANDQTAVQFKHVIEKQRTDKLIEVFGSTAVQKLARVSVDSTPLVFIVGMPRSGTSLVEQVLSSHPLVFGAGELNDINLILADIARQPSSKGTYPDNLTDLDPAILDKHAKNYIERLTSMAGDAERFTDKMPHNFMNLGLIALLFPKAHIIHCRRHPYDTCLSIYFQSFNRMHNYATDLHNLGLFYEEYERLMDYWKSTLVLPILDIVYEELIDNQEIVSRRMIEFVGLDWDDACLDFHKTKRIVSTASYDQVRKPIYRKSVARWKHYEKHIDALKKVMADKPINWPPKD